MGFVEGDYESVSVSTSPYDSATVATLYLLDPAGGSTPVALTAHPDEPTPGTKTWAAVVQYTAPGVWYKRWTVTGTGAGGPKEETVQVAPAASTPVRAYATTADLARAMRDVPPVDAERMLRDASLKIDDLLTSSCYAVDGGGYPTDPDVTQAITDATCALVRWWLATGNDGLGAQRAVTSASVAGVSIGYGTGVNAPDPYGDEVRGILTRAGLIGYGPRIGW